MADVLVRFTEGNQQGADGYAFHLCIGGTWLEFCRWIDGLPVADFPKLHQLCKEGVADDTRKLSMELEDAPIHSLPEDAAAELLGELREKVGFGDVDESVTIVHDQDE